MESPSAEVTEKLAWNYFSRTNHINKSITDQKRSFVKYLGDRWTEIPDERKDALLDLLIVNDGVREIYDGRNQVQQKSQSEDEVQESFPRLYLDSGQKINVDFESDLWTWRDEHSGPFSWMSRSQQDLTLADLEPDNISKPQPKTARIESEEPVKKAEAQFTHPSNSWCLDIVDEYRKNEQSIVLTPSPSVDPLTINVKVEETEEHNPAYEGSVEDVSNIPEHNHHHDSDIKDEEKTDSATEKKSRNKDRSRRSPSPKKIIRSGSFKKSPVKSGDQQLINQDDPDTAEDSNAFSNPLMETEWSTFVGEEAQSNPAVSHSSKISTAPAAMMMDRGGVSSVGAASPYRGDKVQLIEPSNSPSVKLSSPSVSGWSEESTPDHTTHLLKGLQSPVHHRNNHAYSGSEDGSALAALSGNSDKDIYGKAEEDEILRVERDGENITVTSEPEPKRDSSVFKTGFDFLDNW